MESSNVVPLDSVIATADLVRRRREPDYKAENRALVSLAATLASSPDGILEKLVDVAMEPPYPNATGPIDPDQPVAGCGRPGAPGSAAGAPVSSAWYWRSSRSSSSFFGKRKKTSVAPSRIATMPAV